MLRWVVSLLAHVFLLTGSQSVKYSLRRTLDEPVLRGEVKRFYHLSLPHLVDLDC